MEWLWMLFILIIILSFTEFIYYVPSPMQENLTNTPTNENTHITPIDSILALSQMTERKQVEVNNKLEAMDKEIKQNTAQIKSIQNYINQTKQALANAQ